MSNKFLSTAGSGNLTNGSADLFINSLGISNLDQSLPIKTNASRELITSKLDQTDINNLQTDLNLKSELSYTKSDAHTNPPAGQIKTYFKTDGNFYKKDEAGTETKIAGGGTGDVTGPSSSAANQIAIFDATDGKTIKNSAVTIDASNNCVGMNNLTIGGLVDTQTLNVNGVINAGNNINNFGLITSQGYRMQLDNAVDIGETTKQVKDLYIKGNINTLGDIKYNKASQNIQLGINAGGTSQGVGCVDNISIGQGSNPALTTGNNNISLGKDSGKLINTGLSNICIGNSAGQSISSGVGNIILGNNGGGSINTTGGNICIGNSSGQSLDGNSNVFIGSASVGGNVTNAIAIGSSVTNNVSNSCVIGSAINNIRPSGQRSCDLGTNTNQYKDIYGDKVILHTQAQSDKYYNKNGTTGIDITNTPAGNIKLTGTTYNGGTTDRIFTVAADGTMKLSNAILDNVGNLTASNTTLASLQLQNNLTFDADNSHDLGTVATSARSIYYKTNLSGNTATFTGQINSNAIIPVTTNIADLGSTTNGFRNLYLTGNIIGMPYDFIFAATDEVNTITTTGQKMSVRVSRSFQTSKIKVSVNSAGGAGFVVDIKNNGVLVQSIAQGTSLITNTVNTQSYTEDNTITCEVSNVGAGTATGLKVYLIGKTI